MEGRPKIKQPQVMHSTKKTKDSSAVLRAECLGKVTGFPIAKLNMISWMEQKKEPEVPNQDLDQGPEERENKEDAHSEKGKTSENEEWEEEEEEEEIPVVQDCLDPAVVDSPVLDWKEACEVLQDSDGSSSGHASKLLVISAVFVHIASPVPNRSVNAVIAQTFNLLLVMQANSTVLLNTYLSCQGSPFSDSSFSAPRLHYDGVPTAAIQFWKWRTLSDLERLDKNYEAYSALSEFLQLVWDDQFAINPKQVELLEMLKVTRLRIEGLLSNLTAIMSALGGSPTPVTDSFMLESVEASTFEKKIRGYVVCHLYKQWVDRTVRDFALLKQKYPS
ncbi:hypothetical protein JD844_001261 [Phrynosoma platyrhinos]|uniref:Ciliary neurotrophic factor n=1 Tax=Phrynosoma platyrhinos TaxID=52577 RepID=A0ABQ7T9D7_PHRPL|nr:hypothetical protein JD844_001261 [Phrynosoma platyrhinos]